MTEPTSRAAAATDDLRGTPYTVIREIGAGGMGVVVEATDSRSGARCAVKVIRAGGAPDLVERFRLESETLSKGRSPHFVRVLDVGRGAGSAPYYAMELLVGRTAGELVRERGPLPLEDVLALGIQLFDGLAAAHALGVVHRDVKPDNLFLVGDARPAFLKLLDFGIAKVTEATKDGPQPLAVPTAEGLMIGTLRWAAPEVVLASGVDARADLYSAGLVLWSLATGRLVFHHVKTREELLLAQMRDPLPPVATERAEPGFASLDGLISRLTKKAKEERLASASDAASWLRTLLRTELGMELPPVMNGSVPRIEASGSVSSAPVVVPPAARPAGAGPALVTFPQLSPGQRFEGRYQIEGHLGKGGMGTVYRAKQTFLSREVAIKLIPLEARSVNVDLREQFANEMQVLARLDHPNIVKIFDGGVTDDSMAYIVMELLPGSALRIGLQGGVPLKNLQCCLYLTQVANGLMALHSVPILHRDIKPENVMVLPSGEVKIVDFGLARVRTKSKYATRNPNPTGTLHYMPKEQLLNEPLDESVDVFAFGLMLFECFTGQHPRATESGSFQNARETIVSVVEDKPIVPLRSLRSDLPEELLVLAERCVALDPSSRPKPKEIIAVLARVGHWAQTHREPTVLATPAPPDVSPAPELVRTEPLPAVERSRSSEPERFGKRGTVRMAPPVQATPADPPPAPVTPVADTPTADADPTDRMVAPRGPVPSAPLAFARTPERPASALLAEPSPLRADRRDPVASPAPAARAMRNVAVVLVGIVVIAGILVGVELSVPGTIIASRRSGASASASVTSATSAAPSTPFEREAAPPPASAPPTAPPIDTLDAAPSDAPQTPNLPATASPPPRLVAPTATLQAASPAPPPSTSNAPKWRPSWQ